MTVRLRLFAAAALACALLWAAGCSRDAPLAPEMDDPSYVQGVQLKRQVRNPEALTCFLKVIDRRGERGAPESHLQAGEIYLNDIKQPVYAYYHFCRYLELQPNSSQAELVRGMVKASLREFAKTVPGRPLEEQSIRLQAEEELARLRRENDELRAELAVLRGGGATPINRPARMITLPAPGAATTAAVPVAPVVDAPITAAPVLPAPAPGAAAASRPPLITPPVATPPRGGGAAARPPATGTPTRGAGGQSPATSSPTRAPLPTSSGRTHTVVAKDTLFSLSKRYGVKMEDIAAANGLPSVSAPLKLGSVLRIPSPAGAGR